MPDIKFPAIPSANPNDVKSLVASIGAMKEILEILLGQRGDMSNKAILASGLPAAVKAVPGLIPTDGKNGATGAPGSDGRDGEDAWIIPGPPGAPGLAGIIGAPGRDGDDGQDAVFVPGLPGAPGASTIGPPGRDGDDPDSTQWPLFPPNATNFPAKPLGGFMGTPPGGGQTFIGGSAIAKMTFNTVYDVGSHYDGVTNYRWTPPAGLVVLHLHALATVFTSTDLALLVIFKNGASYMQDVFSVKNSFFAAQVVAMDNANGTDYYEAFLQPGANTLSTTNSLVNVSFSGICLG